MADTNTAQALLNNTYHSRGGGGTPASNTPRGRTPLNTDPATNPNIAIRAKTHSLNQSLAAGKISLDDYNQQMGANTAPQSNAVDTNQPSPKTVNPTPFTQTTPQPGIQTPQSAGELPYDQALANLNKGGLTGASLTSAQQSLSNRYQQGHKIATSTGQTAPQSAPVGRTQSSSFTPPEATPPSSNPDLDQVFSPENQVVDQLNKDYQSFFSPQKQQESLTSEYSRLTKESGIDEMDTKLMNMDKVINGTEDDIRNEITKAGGFATDSQVLALTNARNKQMIVNYNQLLQSRDLMQKHLDTVMSLSAQDRQQADTRANQMFNMKMQIATFQQQAQQNTASALNKIVDKVGYDGLSKMIGGDSYYTPLVEKSLGLGVGGLAKLAASPLSQKDQLALQEQKLRIQGQTLQNTGQSLQNQKLQNDLSAPAGGNLPKIQEEGATDYQFAKQAHDTVLNTVKDATGVTDISKLTKKDMSKLTDSQALEISKALSITTNPKSTRATGGEDALGPNGWVQGLINPIRQGFTGKKYTAQSLLDAVKAIQTNYNTIETNYYRNQVPSGQILIKRNGQIGAIPANEFDSKTDEKL